MSTKVKSFRIARFILECFYGIANDMQADHINTIPWDNNIFNLKWKTIVGNANNPTTIAKITHKKRKKPKLTKEKDYTLEIGEYFVECKSHPKLKISNYGTVIITTTGNVTKGTITKERDLVIRHNKHQYVIARLVLETFKGEPANKNYKAIHKDGNNQNNHIDNLDWATHSEINYNAWRIKRNTNIV